MQLVHYLILINLDQSGLPAERSREASRAALRPLLAFPSKSRTWKYLGKYLPQRARVICEAENTVCILRKSGDNWVILQNPSFITMGAAAAFNGPLSFPNWRRDHFAYSDEVPFPQDECVLHTLLHFYLLVVIVERRRRKEPSSIFLLLHRHYSSTLHFLAVTCRVLRILVKFRRTVSNTSPTSVAEQQFIDTCYL